MQLERTNILSYLLFSIIVIAQVTIVKGYDIGDMRTFFITLCGCLFISAYAIWQIKKPEIILLLPFIVYAILIGSSTRFVEGFTIYKVAEMAGIMGIVLLASQVKQKYIWAAFIIAALLQIYFTIFPIAWNMKIAENHLGGFGTVRHAIRFSTILFVAILGLFFFYVKTKSKPWKAFFIALSILFFYYLAMAYSNTIITITAAALLMLLGFIYGWKHTAFGVLSIAIIFIWLNPQGFNMDGPRAQLLACMLKETGLYPLNISVATFLGHGIGAWELNNGALGFLNVGHPHNELMQITYEYGIIGALFFTSTIMVSIFLAKNSILKFAIIGVTLSTFTNALFNYTDIALIWAVLLGAGFADA